MEVFFAQLYSPSLEFILLIIALAADALLAAVVYLNNPRSATNRLFLLLTSSTMLWLITTHVATIPSLIPQSLVLHRLGILFAAPMSASLFLLAYTMPAERPQLSPVWRKTVWALTIGMMLLNMSPYAFTGISVDAGVSNPVPGVGLVPFAVISTIFSALAVYKLVQKYHRSLGDRRRQVGLVLSGMVTMLALIVSTVLVPITFSGSVHFLVFTPLYVLVFLGMTAYAITRYQLFNVKVLLTQALTFLLVLILFGRFFAEQTFDGQVVDGLTLLAAAVAGFYLVRSVRKEVEQRERIELLASELQETNARQEGLIHFIGHEVKGFLTKAEGAFSVLAEGDMGPLQSETQAFVERALKETRDGVVSVSDILQASNLKKGTTAYTMSEFDFARVVERAVTRAQKTAEAKGLTLTLNKDNAACLVRGDEKQLDEHVLRNLLDNAINYTKSGSVTVTLSCTATHVTFSVKDTGVGITPADQERLFTEGGHGANSIKTNVHSTGYGLFIAKTIVSAHGGTIAAASEGQGKGSTFTVTLPVASGG